MIHKIPKGNWTLALARIVSTANDGDTIIVHSDEMKALGERARRRMCPDKRLAFEVATTDAAGREDNMSDTARLQFEMQQLHKERNEAIQRAVRAEAERDALLAASRSSIGWSRRQATGLVQRVITPAAWQQAAGMEMKTMDEINKWSSDALLSAWTIIQMPDFDGDGDMVLHEADIEQMARYIRTADEQMAALLAACEAVVAGSTETEARYGYQVVSIEVMNRLRAAIAKAHGED